MSHELSAEESLPEIQRKLKLDFYRLHYPRRKESKSIHKSQNKMRSKSVVSVIQTNQNEESEVNEINPKGSIKKSVLHKSNLHENSPHKQPIKSYRSGHSYGNSSQPTLSFKSALAPNFKLQSQHISSLPLASLKDLEEQSKKNLNIRLAMQRAKDQKIKMNRIILSHKQSQQIKLEYLRGKKQQVQESIQTEMKSIYDEFFRKEYERQYGQMGEGAFEQKMNELLRMMTKRIFYH